MTGQEFLDELVLRLREKGAERLITEDVNYHRDHIEGGVAKGRHEEEVLSELGDPVLIAWSILGVASYRVDGAPGQNPGGDPGEDTGSCYRTQNEEGERQEDRNIHVEMRQMNSWTVGILFLLLVMLLILAVLGFIGFIIWAALIIPAPLLLSLVYRALMQFFQR